MRRRDLTAITVTVAFVAVVGRVLATPKRSSITVSIVRDPAPSTDAPASTETAATGGIDPEAKQRRWSEIVAAYSKARTDPSAAQWVGGAISTYAELLGLDPEAVAERVRNEAGSAPSSAPATPTPGAAIPAASDPTGVRIVPGRSTPPPPPHPGAQRPVTDDPPSD